MAALLRWRWHLAHGVARRAAASVQSRMRDGRAAVRRARYRWFYRAHVLAAPLYLAALLQHYHEIRAEYVPMRLQPHPVFSPSRC